MYGNLAVSLDAGTALKKATATGAKLAYSEFESFLNTRGTAKNRYVTLARVLAERDAKWSELKQGFEIRLRETISDVQFTNYLNSLKDYGFITHSNDLYSVPDPLLKKALKTS